MIMAREAEGAAARADPGGRECDLGRRLPAARRLSLAQGPHRRDRQHRRRRPAGPRRRAGARRRGSAGAARRHGDADRRRARRARAGAAAVLHRRRRARRRARARTPRPRTIRSGGMPLWRPYDAMLDSKVADINNVAAGGFAGSITAALFLQRFVDDGEGLGCISTSTPGRRRAKPGRPEGGECQAARALYALLVRALRLIADRCRPSIRASRRPGPISRPSISRQGRGRALRRRRRCAR